MRTAFCPNADLRQYVEAFVSESGALGTSVPGIAHTTPSLRFDFKGRLKIRKRRTGAVEQEPPALLIGTHTYRRVDIWYDGDVDSFSIRFQPAGLYRLFAIPATELLNCSCDARTVLGPLVSDLQDALAQASSAQARVLLAEKVLMRQVARSTVNDRNSRLISSISARCENRSVRTLAIDAVISERQLQRTFVANIGLAPKTFARITRFRAALSEKLRNPGEQWTDVAHNFGYCDQSHLLRDFRDFASTSPSHLVAEFQKVPASMCPQPL